MLPRLQGACACAVLMGAASQASFASQHAAAPRVSPVVSWAVGYDEAAAQEIPIEVLELSAVEVGQLAQLLANGSAEQQNAALLALLYAGSDAAVEVLRTSPEALPILYMALGSRGSPADRSELLRALDRDVGDGEDAIAAAAAALGMLRAGEAIPALERLAARSESSAAEAARDALDSIRQPRHEVDALPHASDDDRIIAAALREGILGDEEEAVFDDSGRGGVWILDGNAWRFRRGARAADAPSLDFSTRFNASRTQAILSVSRRAGPKDAAGYDYVLVRDRDTWRVRFVLCSWVA